MKDADLSVQEGQSFPQVSDDSISLLEDYSGVLQLRHRK